MKLTMFSYFKFYICNIFTYLSYDISKSSYINLLKLYKLISSIAYELLLVLDSFISKQKK